MINNLSRDTVSLGLLSILSDIDAGFMWPNLFMAQQVEQAKSRIPHAMNAVSECFFTIGKV